MEGEIDERTGIAIDLSALNKLPAACSFRRVRVREGRELWSDDWG